jgi:NitT/TauT family transport system permease protein
VLSFIAAEIGRGDMLANIGATLGRVVVAFAIAMALGSGIGIALGRWRALDRFFDIWLVLLLNTPALVITVLYLWLGLTETAAIVAVALNKLPNGGDPARRRAMEPALDEMSAAFLVARLRHVAAPGGALPGGAARRPGAGVEGGAGGGAAGRPNGVSYAISYYSSFSTSAVLGYNSPPPSSCLP